MKKYIFAGIAIFFVLAFLSEQDKNSPQTKTESSGTQSTEEIRTTHTQTPSNEEPETTVTNSEIGGWNEHKKNPVIKYGDKIRKILWGDASVIKEGGIYKMWLSGGEPFSRPIVVKIYYATSTDGIDWDINKKPILLPTKGAWDSHGVETPSVIKVGSTYHMYYTGYNTDFSTAVYSIGHATSQDGVNWTKASNNPIIEPQEDPLKWGYFTTAEPAIVHYSGTFYLYYTSAKSNWPDDGAPFGIMVATSDDGTNFGKGKIAHTLSSSYDAKKYRGYSTPAVYVDNGTFHLYYDVVYNPDGFDQVAISSAVSSSGFDFKEVEKDIFSTGEKAWRNYSILAPSVLLDGNTVKMWFSGQTTDSSSSGFDFGIGYATKEVK